MMTRRTFSTLLAGAACAPDAALAQAGAARLAYYSGVGTDFTHYDVDVATATLTKRATVKLPASVQYAWPHPSRKFLYISSSSGGPGESGAEHFVTAFAIDPSTGALKQHGASIKTRWRAVHNSVDRAGDFLIVAYNEPSGVSVHRISPDGTIGDEVAQTEKLDVGVYGHQVTVTPGNNSLILVTRGNNATGGKPEDPGSLKVYGFNKGALTMKASVQPGTGHGFGARHLDYHPTKPWVYVSVERQNKLAVYELKPDGGLSADPLFIKSTVLGQDRHISSAGPIHVHPDGRFVYLTNRAGWGSSVPANQEKFEGLNVFPSNDSSIAVFAINQQTGEPTLIETTDSHGAHPRTFALDPSGRMLVSGSLVAIALKKDGKIKKLPAGLSVFRVGDDGKPVFQRRYDIEVGRGTQWWSGMVTLA